MRVSFQITQNMVDQFAELTGDRSPLHVDPDFGRRSSYKNNIVHGVLPVTFAALIKRVLPREIDFYLESLSARFLKPVFAGDLLRLDVQPVNVSDRDQLLEYDFTISNSQNQTIVTTGKVGFRKITADSLEAPPQIEQTSRSMIVDTLPPADLTMAEIGIKDKHQFSFCLHKIQAELLNDLISDALQANVVSDVINVDANWLAACMFSTFVGICIPGRYAVLLEIQAHFSNKLLWSDDYQFAGEVKRVARAMKTVVENGSIYLAGDPQQEAATGKMTVQIDDPPEGIPSVEMLKQTATDLGLAGKVVLITGASRGIGEATAKLFSANGAVVAINYLQRRDDAERVAAEITANGGRVFVTQADVADDAQVRRMVGEVTAAYGTIDVLVNNAAGDFLPHDFLNLTWDEIQYDIDVILRGAFNCSQAVIPMMIANKGGRIINISSTATDIPPQGQTKYVIAKSGLVGLTRSLAVEFAAQNILVNAVVPGLVKTDLTRHISPLKLEQILLDTPLARHATPLDVAKAVLFLASSLASYTTGERILVTGGNPPLL